MFFSGKELKLTRWEDKLGEIIKIRFLFLNMPGFIDTLIEEGNHL